MTDDTHDENLRSVEIARIGPARFKATNARGGETFFGTGGEDPDFTPVELLLTAIAGCSALDVEAITHKRTSSTTFDVHAEGRKVRDEQGNHLTGLRVSFDVDFPVETRIDFPDTASLGLAYVVTGETHPFEHGIGMMNADGTSPAMVWREPGTVGPPSWSPDGTQIAYVEDDHGQQSLAIVDQHGSKAPRRLGLGADYHDLVAWGGDGTLHEVGSELAFRDEARAIRREVQRGLIEQIEEESGRHDLMVIGKDTDFHFDFDATTSDTPNEPVKKVTR